MCVCVKWGPSVRHMNLNSNLCKSCDKLVHCTFELYIYIHSGILDSHNSNTNYVTIHWTYLIFHATTFVSRLTSRPFPFYKVIVKSEQSKIFLIATGF